MEPNDDKGIDELRIALSAILAAADHGQVCIALSMAVETLVQTEADKRGVTLSPLQLELITIKNILLALDKAGRTMLQEMQDQQPETTATAEDAAKAAEIADAAIARAKGGTVPGNGTVH